MSGLFGGGSSPPPPPPPPPPTPPPPIPPPAPMPVPDDTVIGLQNQRRAALAGATGMASTILSDNSNSGTVGSSSDTKLGG